MRDHHNEPAADPDLIGQPPRDKYREQFGVIVICADEAEHQAVYEDLHGRGLNVRVVKV